MAQILDQGLQIECFFHQFSNFKIKGFFLFSSNKIAFFLYNFKLSSILFQSGFVKLAFPALCAGKV